MAWFRSLDNNKAVNYTYGNKVISSVIRYILNLQGDVVRIVNSAGVVRAEYTYNAWGELLSASGPVCNLNPLRYRGYVYDDETGLYYLNSRYYDPANRRMLSPDDLSVLNASPTSLNDKNLYTYCDNNPVSRKDDDGQFWAEVFTGAAIGAIWGGVTALMTGEDVVTGVGYGALSGAASGAVSCIEGVKLITIGVKAVLNGFINCGAYVVGNKGNTNLLGIGTAFVTGAVTGAWSAYVAPPAVGKFAGGVATYLSTTTMAVLTGVAHGVGKAFKAKQTSNTSKTGKPSVAAKPAQQPKVRRSGRYYPKIARL